MQIVIKIPDEEFYTGQLIHYFGVYSDKLDKVIYSGTTLRRNHGRLIDADELLYLSESSEHHDVIEAWVDGAPTVLKADTEVQDEFDE